MKFEEALVELRKGKKIRKVLWLFTQYMDLKNYKQFFFDAEEVLNSEWELYQEPGKSFPEVFEAFKSGKFIKRKEWENKHLFGSEMSSIHLSYKDVLATDWEIID